MAQTGVVAILINFAKVNKFSLLQWSQSNLGLQNTCLIQTPLYYGHFSLSLGKAFTFSLASTSFIWTPIDANSGHLLLAQLTRLLNSRFFFSKSVKKSVKRGVRVLHAQSAWASHVRLSLFSALFQTFCLTARAYLNTQKYGLFCSLPINRFSSEVNLGNADTLLSTVSWNKPFLF